MRINQGNMAGGTTPSKRSVQMDRVHQALLQALKNQVDSTVLGNVPDGSISQPKFSTTNTAVIPFVSTTGTANAYTATLSPAPVSYTDGMAVSVKVNADSTGASTLNVNGLGAKGLKKSSGLDATGLKENGVYTFRYNSTTGNFILQGEGGVDTTDATAISTDILASKTAYANEVKITGTMANRGAMTITPGTTDQIIPQGYHNGNGVVIGDPDLIAANILSGKNIFGIDGSAIDGTNMKKKANGTATTSGTTESFVMADGTNYSTYSVNVTGLDFIPSLILVYGQPSTDITRTTIYSSDVLMSWGSANIITGEAYKSGANYRGAGYKVDGTHAYVNNGNFKLPFDQISFSVNWIAIGI